MSATWRNPIILDQAKEKLAVHVFGNVSKISALQVQMFFLTKLNHCLKGSEILRQSHFYIIVLKEHSMSQLMLYNSSKCDLKI